MRSLVLPLVLAALGAESFGAGIQETVEVISPVQEATPVVESVVPSSQGSGEKEVLRTQDDPAQEKSGEVSGEEVDSTGNAQEDEVLDSSKPAEAPVVAPPVMPLDLKPMTGFGHEVWSGTGSEPIVRILGSGAPELFVQVDTDHATVAQVGWLQELGDSLEAAIGQGEGTIHLLVDSGVSANKVQERPLFDDRSESYLASNSTESDPQGSHAAAAKYLESHPHAVHRVLLGFPKIWEQRIGTRDGEYQVGFASRESDDEEFNLDTWEDFVRIGLGVGASTVLQVEPEPRTFYRLQGETEWTCESDGSGSSDSEYLKANVGKILETCPGTKAPARAAKELIRTLEDLARIRVLGDIEVMPMGGELWQVEFLLGAPTMQIEAIDPLRTYPRDSFGVQFDWGPSMVTGEDSEAPILPSLAYLAWQPAGQDYFELLPTHNGSFRFPGQGIPEGARLRFGIQAPVGVGKLIGLALNSRLHGEARVEFVAPSLREIAADESLGDEPPLEGEAEPETDS
ncbi:MAG: hypothetical protein ACI8Q9_000482 [Planctomycetota bacterium]